jgi:hypothetical protein
MPNNIIPAEKWVPLLDEVYQNAATSSALDTDARLLTWLADSREFRLAKLSMDGLGDYDRALGYPKGNVTLAWETHAPDYERGRMFTVDTMDDEEAAGLVMANLAAEFIRTKVAPELDAVRYARYASLVPAENKVAAAIADASALISALRTASNKMDEAQVPEEGRLLFITPSLISLVEDMDNTKSKAVLERFSLRQKVPQVRFYSAVELFDGKTAGEEAGGFAKATGAKNINFLIAHKPAVLQSLKHVAPKIISPQANQDADSWKYGYRTYGIADAQELKLAGLYVHTAA